MESMSLFNAKDVSSIDLSKFNTVFCDSLQALEWAYNNGLPKSATIKSSAPAVLWEKKEHIHNVESRWTIDELEKFQSTIYKLTKDVFDAVLNIDGVDRELALCISQSVYQFQKILYKSACLDLDDFTNPRLFIYVDGKIGPAGNMMNSPWDKLLSHNQLFSMITYTLKNDEWKVLSTKGVSYLKRFKVAGYETIMYRLALKLMKKLPTGIFNKELILPNENELNIEIASSLILNGVKISSIKIDSFVDIDNAMLDDKVLEIYKEVLPIMQKRVEEWVVAPAIEVTMSLFTLHMEEQIKKFKLLVSKLEKVIVKNKRVKKTVLMNSPGNINGQALSYVCKNNHIPLVSSQHGITVEISKAHDMMHFKLDNSVADIMLSYNPKIINIEKNTYFNKSKHYMVGMPLRLMRMKYSKAIDKSVPPIVYISTNLYHMGLSLSSKTDYSRAISEKELITKVLGRLPHKIRYKTYPEDNRRYADIDPVLNYVKLSSNIELFSDKIDMRYLVSEHSIFVTTCATSTLGWPVMSERPVIFINQKKHSPLTNEAHISLSKAIFVFDDDKDNFHRNLRDFLSQPLEEIEKLWKEKKVSRENMIKNYFSAYNGAAGKRAAKIILKECF
jgi:hypothetical protein